MGINLIDKIVPKNDAFTGLVDASQVIGGVGNTLPIACETDPLAWLKDSDQSSLTGDKSGTFDLTTTGIVTVGTLTQTGAGNQYLTVISTDHLISGIRLQRGSLLTDTYNDYVLYNNGGSLYIDKLASNVTSNIFSYTTSTGVFSFGSSPITAGAITGTSFVIGSSSITSFEELNYLLSAINMTSGGTISVIAPISSNSNITTTGIISGNFSGVLLSDGSTPLTSDWNAGDYYITAKGFYSTEGGSSVFNEDVVIETMTIGGGSITDSTGAISFGDESLSTSGTFASGTTTITGNLNLGTLSNSATRTLTIHCTNSYESIIKFLETSTYGMGLRYTATGNALYIDRYANSSTPTICMKFNRDDNSIYIYGDLTSDDDITATSFTIGSSTLTSADFVELKYLVSTINMTSGGALSITAPVLASNYISSTGDIRLLSDTNKLEIGNVSGGDLQLYHNGTNSYIDDVTGSFYIRNTNITQSTIGKLLFVSDSIITTNSSDSYKGLLFDTSIDQTGKYSSLIEGILFLTDITGGSGGSGFYGTAKHYGVHFDTNFVGTGNYTDPFQNLLLGIYYDTNISGNWGSSYNHSITCFQLDTVFDSATFSTPADAYVTKNTTTLTNTDIAYCYLNDIQLKMTGTGRASRIYGNRTFITPVTTTPEIISVITLYAAMFNSSYIDSCTTSNAILKGYETLIPRGKGSLYGFYGVVSSTASTLNTGLYLSVSGATTNRSIDIVVGDAIIESNYKWLFRDSAISINSDDDGHLDLTADTSVDINTPLLALGSANITTSGTIGAGAITGTSFTIGATTLTSDNFTELSYLLSILSTGSNDILTITSDITTSGNVIVNGGQYYSVKYTCTTTLDWDNGNVQYIQLSSGLNTFTFASPRDGARYCLILKQPSAGAEGTVSWPGDVLWSGGITPVLTITNDSVDIVTLVWDSTNQRYYAGFSSDY